MKVCFFYFFDAKIMPFVQSAKKNAHFLTKNLEFLDFTPIFVAEKRQNYLYNEKNTICINPYVYRIDTPVWFCRGT